MLPRLIQREAKPGVAKRVRSPGHLAWVRKHGCCVPGCSGMPIQAAHVSGSHDGGTGIKPGDQWTISLCGPHMTSPAHWHGGHHAEQHRIGEPAFERKHGINMVELAKEFAARSPFRGKWR